MVYLEKKIKNLALAKSEKLVFIYTLRFIHKTVALTQNEENRKELKKKKGTFASKDKFRDDFKRN
jgi:hypothetical protein